MSISPCIGVDFGGTSIKIAVCQGETLLARAKPIITQELDSPQAIIDAMCASIEELRAQYPDVCAVGLGMPGWVDFKNGILGRLVNVPAWNESTPVRDIMEEALGIPVALDNDANCMGYAEWKLGAGKGVENLVTITLGTGIGGGIVVHNKMLRGNIAPAAEIGMCSIDYKGRVGPYGNRGGVEEYIGHREMNMDAIARYAEAGITKTSEECDPYQLELAARAGDEIARQIYVDFAEKLACLMMNFMYTIAPEMFILGGGVAKAGDLLWEPLDAFLKEQLMPALYSALRIEPAKFGADAGILGAAMMAWDEAQARAAAAK